MPRAPKLKVFCAPMGFYDALVAAPSQKAALKAWGTTTDLFAAGRASVVEDPELQGLALAKPGEVVKHSRGDEAAIIREIEEHEPAEKKQPRKGGKPAGQRERRAPPDRSKLEQAERALDDARRELEKRLSEIGRKRLELDAEERTVRLEAETALFELERARDKEHRAYEGAVERPR